MYFRKIELINIQKHAHLSLNLRNGVNVLWGKTGCGKSGIIRAFQWILGNDFSSDDIRRDDTKTSSVAITLDSDIIIKRIRSASVNRYEITYPDNRETETHDSVGRTVPDVVKELFALPIMTIDKEDIILNIHSQDDPPYLISNKGTYRSKVLNKLTGNDLLDTIIKSFNSDVLALARDERTNQSIIKTAEKSLAEIDIEVEPKKVLLKKVAVLFNNIEAEQEELSDLETILNRYNTNITAQKQVNIIEIPDIKNIDKLKDDARLLSKISDLYTKLCDNVALQRRSELAMGKDLPEVDIDSLREEIEHIGIVERLAIRRTKNTGSIKETIENLKGLEGDISILIAKYKEIPIPEIVCPKCGTKIKEYEVKDIGA